MISMSAEGAKPFKTKRLARVTLSCLSRPRQLANRNAVLTAHHNKRQKTGNAKGCSVNYVWIALSATVSDHSALSCKILDSNTTCVTTPARFGKTRHHFCCVFATTDQLGDFVVCVRLVSCVVFCFKPKFTPVAWLEAVAMVLKTESLHL